MKKIDSKVIKASLLYYFRYLRNQICSTEYSYRCMDFATITKNELLKEVEIKISKSDLLADKKKRKHHFYKNISTYYVKSVIFPNYFYYCVPTSLIDEAKLLIDEINDKYGLIEYIEDKHNYARALEKRIQVIKRAKLLHNGKTNVYHMALRNSSELCKYYEKEVM